MKNDRSKNPTAYSKDAHQPQANQQGGYKQPYDPNKGAGLGKQNPNPQQKIQNPQQKGNWNPNAGNTGTGTKTK